MLESDMFLLKKIIIKKNVVNGMIKKSSPTTLNQL